LQVLLLYAVVVLIWGSTWAAIPFQLGTVAEEVSVGYRFGLAALALYAFAYVSRRPLRLPAIAFPFVLLQGALLFCINYFFVYYGTAYLTSGIVAVLFSGILILNAIFERLFFGRTIDARFWLAAAVGISGIGLIFSTEISDFRDAGVVRHADRIARQHGSGIQYKTRPARCRRERARHGVRGHTGIADRCGARKAPGILATRGLYPFTPLSRGVRFGGGVRLLPGPAATHRRRSRVLQFGIVPGRCATDIDRLRRIPVDDSCRSRHATHPRGQLADFESAEK
jgi:hypothetical protein